MMKISCVIRTFNEEKLLGRCLETLFAQEGVGTPETVIVDSGSTDGTLAIARKYPVRLLHIARSDLKSFDYSAALNQGIEVCHGELVLIMSAHTIPLSRDWLTLMAGHFRIADVAGVYARQIPWPDADWDEKLRIGQMFGETSRTFHPEDAEKLSVFSNSASCIRRSFWTANPFSLPAAEDLEWARRMLRLGHRIVYEAQAVCYHSHKESARRQAERIINILRSADLKRGRKHTPLRNSLQAVNGLIHEAGQILRLPERAGRRMLHIRKAVAKCFWAIIEGLSA